MSKDTEKLQTVLKEALVLFEASFVQFTKKPTKANIDELINSGNIYKEHWISAMSDEEVAGDIEKLNETLALSSRSLDYRKSDELNTRLENIDASAEEHEETLNKAVEDSFKKSQKAKRRDEKEEIIKPKKIDVSSGSELYIRTASIISGGSSLSIFGEEDVKILPSITDGKQSLKIQQTLTKDLGITTALNSIPQIIAHQTEVSKADLNNLVIPISQLIPTSPESVQKIDLDMMINSIRKEGFFSPIHVYAEDNVLSQSGKKLDARTYRILDGDKRYLAAKALGVKSIPAFINPIGVMGEHTFISQNLSARGESLGGKTYTRRWYYEQPSQDTLLKWGNQIKDTFSKDSSYFRDLINQDLHTMEENINFGTKKKLQLRDAWWVKRHDFEDLLIKSARSNQLTHKNDDRRDWYPVEKFKTSDQLTKSEKEKYLATFTLPHERFQFNFPHMYFAFQDTYKHKPANDKVLLPNHFATPSETDSKNRIWRDVIIYSPDFITIRSATTNLEYKNSAAIPDNSNWVISNDMPSLSNQVLHSFIELVSPEIAKEVKKNDTTN